MGRELGEGTRMRELGGGTRTRVRKAERLRSVGKELGGGTRTRVRGLGNESRRRRGGEGGKAHVRVGSLVGVTIGVAAGVAVGWTSQPFGCLGRNAVFHAHYAIWMHGLTDYWGRREDEQNSLVSNTPAQNNRTIGSHLHSSSPAHTRAEHRWQQHKRSGPASSVPVVVRLWVPPPPNTYTHTHTHTRTHAHTRAAYRWQQHKLAQRPSDVCVCRGAGDVQSVEALRRARQCQRRRPKCGVVWIALVQPGQFPHLARECAVEADQRCLQMRQGAGGGGVRCRVGSVEMWESVGQRVCMLQALAEPRQVPCLACARAAQAVSPTKEMRCMQEEVGVKGWESEACGWKSEVVRGAGGRVRL
eukprot:366373-Chlamydomonas_euryale.AAC.4